MEETEGKSCRVFVVGGTPSKPISDFDPSIHLQPKPEHVISDEIELEMKLVHKYGEECVEEVKREFELINMEYLEKICATDITKKYRFEMDVLVSSGVVGGFLGSGIRLFLQDNEKENFLEFVESVERNRGMRLYFIFSNESEDAFCERGTFIKPHRHCTNCYIEAPWMGWSRRKCGEFEFETDVKLTTKKSFGYDFMDIICDGSAIRIISLKRKHRK